jgi:hypothetical protein
MRYFVSQPHETRPSLVVETCESITTDRIRAFRNDLFGRGCAHGLLFDEHEAVLLRDAFWTMSADSIKEEARLSTDVVLHRAQGESLDARVQDWLARMASSWNEALPEDGDAAAALLHDVVPALSGSAVHAA